MKKLSGRILISSFSKTDAVRLILFVWILIISVACEKESPIVSQNKSILIDEGFEKLILNDKVLSTKKLDTTHFSISRDFMPNLDETMIYIGNEKQGWVYAQLINLTSATKNLVFELKHQRSDKVVIYKLLKDGHLKPIDSVGRTTPLSKRHYSTFEFTVPVHIQARDTVNYILYSEKEWSSHVLDLSLYSHDKYIEKSIKDSIINNLQAGVFITLSIIILIIGISFLQKSIIFLGVYLIAISFGIIAHFGYFYTFPYPKSILLSASNILGFTPLLINISFYPICYELIKESLRNKRKYLIGASILTLYNLAIIVLHFLPKEVCPHRNFLYQAFVISVFINLAWGIFYFYLHYRQTGKILYLLTILSASIPGFVQIVLNFSTLDLNRIFYLKAYNPLLALIIMIYVTFKQFLDELGSKRRHFENINQLKQTMEQIRQSEIEKIGRNLHDQVGNTLASALGYLNLKVPNLDMSKGLIMEGISELRFLSQNLVKTDDKPLTEKVELLTSRFNDFSETAFYFNDYTEGKINQIDSLKLQNIYMIIQELFTNVIKHAQATEMYIQFFETTHSFRIMIEDDGIGIENDKMDKGIGLKNIYKRAKLSDLKVTLDSTSNGSNFIIEIKK